MHLSSLIAQLNNLKLPKGKYVVVSSGALAAHGIREANDLDILVTQEVFSDLAKKHQITTHSGREVIESGDLEIMGKGSIFTEGEIATIEEILSSADVIDGVPYINLNLLKKFKQKMGREKDLKDIELIEKYQNKMI
jgi:hypothetical protein